MAELGHGIKQKCSKGPRPTIDWSCTGGTTDPRHLCEGDCSILKALATLIDVGPPRAPQAQSPGLRLGFVANSSSSSSSVPLLRSGNLLSLSSSRGACGLIFAALLKPTSRAAFYSAWPCSGSSGSSGFLALPFFFLLGEAHHFQEGALPAGRIFVCAQAPPPCCLRKRSQVMLDGCCQNWAQLTMLADLRR